MDSVLHSSTVLAAFFTIMNPIAKPRARRLVAVQAVLLAFAIVAAFTFSGAGGRGPAQVVTRLMGLVLAVVGVQMLIAGIQGVVAAS